MATRNPAKYFIKKDVQELLIKLTGLNLKKIFKPSFNPKQLNSNIELLTDEQLEQENKNTLDKARNLLQMPPFLNARKNEIKILAKDERLNPLNKTNSNYVFVDISLNIPDKKRMVIVREPNGILRKANDDEHEKMLQVYFPKEGKPNYVPKMFEQTNLEECLKLKHYLILLNKASLKYEPNDPEYIRVTHRIYEYINEVKDFDALHSTRFFGPMVFYLCWYNKLDNLIAHLIENSNMEDCVRVMNIYYILNENDAKSKLYSSNKTEAIDLIKNFIENDMTKNEKSMKVLKIYLESTKKALKSY